MGKWKLYVTISVGNGWTAQMMMKMFTKRIITDDETRVYIFRTMDGLR